MWANKQVSKSASILVCERERKIIRKWQNKTKQKKMRNKKQKWSVKGKSSEVTIIEELMEGETEARAHMQKNETWRMRAMCVCVFSAVIMSLCLCFQRPSVDWLPHTRFPQLPSAPSNTHRGPQITPTAPHGPRTDPVLLVFPFLLPGEKSSPGERLMSYAFFWCQEFGTRLLEHKGQREGERRGKTEERAA